MPRVDMGKNLGNMSEVEQHYIKKLEALNFERANKMRKMRTRNRMIGGLLAGLVLGGCILHLLHVTLFTSLPNTCTCNHHVHGHVLLIMIRPVRHT